MNRVVVAFRAVAVAEALSWTGLLIGMVFKYLVVGNEIGVKIFGPIHGGLFLLYLVVAVLVRRPLRWGTATTVLALVASVPPLGTLIFERWATRTGRLRADALAHGSPRSAGPGRSAASAAQQGDHLV